MMVYQLQLRPNQLNISY